MAIKIGKGDVIWGYLGLILYNGINILLLPVILKQLSSVELGLWYTFTATGALALLIDFGFMSTVTRNVAFAWSGAATIEKVGISSAGMTGEPNIRQFATIVAICRYIYFGMSAVVLLILATVGTLYIRYVVDSSLPLMLFLPAWLIYIVAIACNIYFAYWTPIMKGIGAIKQNYQILVYSRFVQLFVSLIGLWLGYKLLAVAIAYFAGNLAVRVLSQIMFFRYPDIVERKEQLRAQKPTLHEQRVLFANLWPNAYRQGTISISTFLVDKAAVLISSAFLGLEVTGMLGLTQQLFGLISSIGNTLFNTYLPLFSQLRLQQNVKKAYRYFTLSLGAQNAIILAGGLFIIVFGNPLLTLIGSHSSLLPIGPASILLLSIFLFNTHIICGAYIITGNRIPMCKPYIITGVIIVCLQFVLARWTSLGIWAILLPLLVVQLAYNNWKWPAAAARELQVTPLRLFTDSVFGFTQLFQKGALRDIDHCEPMPISGDEVTETETTCTPATN